MNRNPLLALLLTLTPTLLAAAQTTPAPEKWWPQFRGPNASGLAATAKPPIHFSPTQNVQWKIPVGAGISSPIVWDDRIFLTEFDPATRKLATLCLDRPTGRVLWRRAVTPDQIEEVHELSSPAAATPATDGERVYVYFGSYGLLCYDFDGSQKWEMRLPLPQNYYGASSSPILAGEFLILNHHGKDSYLLAVHRRDGRIAWKTDRSLFQFGWSTPVHWRRHSPNDRLDEILVQGGDFAPNQRVMAYDLATGAERWWVGGLPACGKSTPVLGDGLLFLAASDIIMEPAAEKQNPDRAARFYANNAARVMAVRPPTPARPNTAAPRQIPDQNIVWTERKGVPGVPSLLYTNGRLYSFKDGGLVSCRDAKTGSLLYNERIGALGYYYSSPVTADDKIYIASAQGTVTVLAESPTFQTLATNNLNSPILATPALAAQNIYIRTADHLYAFQN